MGVRGFGDLEAAIMDRLWAREVPATVRQLLEDLSERDLAYNTVLTVVDNLYKKGWLSRQPAGRAFQYTAVATRGEYTSKLMRDALNEAGDPAEALTRFVGQMNAEETAALRAALAEFESGGYR